MAAVVYNVAFVLIVLVGLTHAGYFTWIFRPTSRWRVASLDAWWLIAAVFLLYLWVLIRYMIGLVRPPEDIWEAAGGLSLGALIDIGLIIRIVRWRGIYRDAKRDGHPLRRKTDAIRDRLHGRS